MKQLSVKKISCVILLILSANIYAQTQTDTIQIPEKATIATPPAGWAAIGFKSGTGIIAKDSAGVEKLLDPPVTSVFGRTGAVTAQSGDYSKSDVGLGNVDNTSDADKPVSTAQQAALDLKQDALGFTAEDSANKGIANGYASLDANGKLPASQLNLNSTTRVVTDIAARDALTDMIEGTECWVTDASDDATVDSGTAKYLYSGSTWIKTAEAESMDVIIAWENVTSKPQIITDIAAVTGSDNDVLQKVSGSWISRTMAQLKATLGLDNVTNESKTTMFANPTFTGQVLLSDTSYSHATGGLVFGDGDTIIYESMDDVLIIRLSGLSFCYMDYNKLYLANGAMLRNTTTSETTPTLAPNNADDDTGIGAKASNILTLIAGGTGACNVTVSGIEVPGTIGAGTTGPTAKVHIAAGTATAGTAPLKLTSGTNLTTPEDGAVEYDGSNLYFTVSSTRKTIATQDTTPVLSSGTAAPTSTPGKVGDIYVDTTNLKLYFATGTSSSADWTAAN